MSVPRRCLVPFVLASAAVAAGCGQVPSASPSAATAASPSAVATSASSPSSSGTPSGSASASAGGGSCEYTTSGTAAKTVNPPPATGVPTSGKVTYALTMSGGTVKITMDRSKAPCTVNSFVSLANQGYYDNTTCHRLADSGIFILQCGDPTGTGSGGPGYQFADETDGTEKYTSGVVAMANAGTDTNGSQFFLVWDDSALPPNYTIFGTLDKTGRDYVAAIASQGQDGRYGDGTGKPNAPAEILTAKKV